MSWPITRGVPCGESARTEKLLSLPNSLHNGGSLSIEFRRARMDRCAVSRDEYRNYGMRSKHIDLSALKTRATLVVSVWRPCQERIAPHEPRAIVNGDIRAVGQSAKIRSIRPLDAWSGKPFALELAVDDIGSDRSAVTGRPQLAESTIIRATTLGTRPVTCRECSRLVEEKELSIRVWPHDDAADLTEFRQARDPPSHLRVSNDVPVIVVQDAAISQQKAATADRCDLTKRRHAILQRHRIATARQREAGSYVTFTGRTNCKSCRKRTPRSCRRRLHTWCRRASHRWRGPRPRTDMLASSGSCKSSSTIRVA
jgi:hypothetical protein